MTPAQLEALGIDITPRYVTGENDEARDGRWRGEVQYLEPGIALTMVALVFGESLEELRDRKLAIRDSLQISKEVEDMDVSVFQADSEVEDGRDA